MIEGRVRGQFEFSRPPRSTNPTTAVQQLPLVNSLKKKKTALLPEDL